MFADTYILKVDVPFSEYWLPLLIGMGVGVLALTAGKVASGHRKRIHEKPKQTCDHDPFTQGSATEQRRSFRRQGNPTEVYIAFPDHKKSPARAWVLDRSMGGLCMQASTEYDPGTQLAVLPVNAPEMTPWVDITVRTCRPLKDGHE